MRKALVAFVGGLLAVFGLATTSAWAETAPNGQGVDINLVLGAQTGLYNDAFRTASWGVEFDTTWESGSYVYPLKKATLTFPPRSQMTWNPDPKMPICPDSKIRLDGGADDPVKTSSFPVPEALKRCGTSLIGNGTAKFAAVGSTNLLLDGQILIFNFGRSDEGDPKIKIWAYSYDTGAGIVTVGTLSPEGEISFEVPRLTNDSSITSMDLRIPSTSQNVYIVPLDETVNLPAGRTAGYVKAKCSTGAFDFGIANELGNRDSEGLPSGPTYTSEDSGSLPCTGTPAPPARLAKPTISGPGTAKRGKVTSYRVTIRNTGGLPASGVRLKASGRGVSVNAAVGTIAGESSRTVTIKAKFRSAGRIKATFTASSSNGGTQRAVKTIVVR